MNNARSSMVLVVVASMLLLGSGCGPEAARQQRQASSATLRFREVDSFIFRYSYCQEHDTATVYEDTKTGVRYLYVWSGLNNGGPAITRLWGE